MPKQFKMYQLPKHAGAEKGKRNKILIYEHKWRPNHYTARTTTGHT